MYAIAFKEKYQNLAQILACTNILCTIAFEGNLKFLQASFMSAKNEFLQSVKKIQVHVTEIYSRSIIVILIPLFKAKLTLEFHGIATTNYCKKKKKL